MSDPQTAGRPGLHYLPGFITTAEQAALVQAIDTSESNGGLRTRRTQHHGWIYDYQARVLKPEHHLGPLPDWLQPIADRLSSMTSLFSDTPAQVIINEYGPGQGVAWHHDALTFGPEIATISLLEDWQMEFDRRPQANQQDGERSSLLEAGSCLIMTGDARYHWKHSIPRRRTEKHGVERERRLSLTLRTVPQR